MFVVIEVGVLFWGVMYILVVVVMVVMQNVVMVLCGGFVVLFGVIGVVIVCGVCIVVINCIGNVEDWCFLFLLFEIE